jgi:hypothetical protein
MQQVYKVLGDIENLARCTPAKVGESSEWTSIANSHPEGECIVRTKWCSEQNLSGINDPGQLFP